VKGIARWLRRRIAEVRQMRERTRILLMGAGLLLLVLVALVERSPYIGNILSQSAVLAVMALGQTFVILTAGIDLSVASVGAFAGALTAGFIVNGGMAPLAAMLVAIVIGGAIGLFNGILIHKFKIAPFVATLAMLVIARGATLLYTNGAPISSDHPTFTALSSATRFAIPPAVVVMILLYALGYVVLKHTPYGLHVYAVGNNKKTARLSGVAVGRVTIIAYALCSMCAALGGIMLASRLWSAQPNAALGFELDVIAVVVLGGSSLFGGIGGVQGTLIGVLLLGFLSSGMNLMQIPAYGQRVVWGAILIAVMAFDINIRQRGRARAVS